MGGDTTTASDSLSDHEQGLPGGPLPQAATDMGSATAPQAMGDSATTAPFAASSGSADGAAGSGSGADLDATAPDDRTRQMEAQLATLQAEHESLKGQYMRIAADFDNFRKRQSRDRDDLRLQITCTTLSEILPVVDNFDRARQQLNPQGEEAQNLHRSYQNLYKQLVDVFKQLGVSPMRVEGEPFDPTLHEAVLREPSHDHPEDVVIEELQRGYHLDGRVLRHALVKVSMGPGPGVNGPLSDNEAGGEGGRSEDRDG
jgi:molecular chaperone GrpE